MDNTRLKAAIEHTLLKPTATARDIKGFARKP